MATTAPSPTTIRVRYGVTTGVLVALGIAAGMWIPSGVVFTLPDSAQGITVFAVLYVLAQAIERINQILVPIFDKVIGQANSATKRKKAALTVVRQQRLTLASPAATPAQLGTAVAAGSDDEDKVTDANIDKALLTNGLGFLLAMIAIALFKFSLLNSIGFSGIPEAVDQIVTATAIMGGSAGLGELIAKIQKSKAADEVKA